MKDENLADILKNCKNLKSLNISGCHSLTDKIFDDISFLSKRLEIIELAELNQLDMHNFYKMNELFLIKKINISHTTINNESLRRFLVQQPKNLQNLEFFNLDGCSFLDKETIFFLCYFKLPRLKYLNLAHNLNFEENDIWKLVSCIETLVDLEVEECFLTNKIRNQLDLNRIFAQQKNVNNK